MRRTSLAVSGIVAVLLLPGFAGAVGGGGVNYIVREVRVAPIRAHVGDVIRIDILIENQGDDEPIPPMRVVSARANRKVVASKLVNYALEAQGGRIRVNLLWDTKGTAPGAYKIHVDAFLWEDSSPFDNEMDVKETVTLLAPGASFPEGVQGGGEAVETDPRYKKAGEPGRE